MKNTGKISIIYFVGIGFLILAVVLLFFVKNKINYNDKIFTTKIVTIYGREECKYCSMAQNLMEKHDIKYKYIELTQDLYQKLMSETGQKTVPYVFVDDNFIGGYQDLESFKDW